MKELLTPESVEVEEQQEVFLVDEVVYIALAEVLVDEFEHSNLLRTDWIAALLTSEGNCLIVLAFAADGRLLLAETTKHSRYYYTIEAAATLS